MSLEKNNPISIMEFLGKWQLEDMRQADFIAYELKILTRRARSPIEGMVSTYQSQDRGQQVYLRAPESVQVRLWSSGESGDIDSLRVRGGGE